MENRDKWMKRRRELMDWCGQCVGFRAKGLALPTMEEGHVCQPNEACPKHCPGFQIDFDEIAQELSGDVAELAVEMQGETVENIPTDKPARAVHCKNCGRSDEKGYLIPVQHAGESTWICTRCLPSLIHG
ncbi:4Fe-4S binding protein [Desulfotomaculum defluvii]